MIFGIKLHLNDYLRIALVFLCIVAIYPDSKAQVCEGEWFVQEDQAARGDWKRHESGFVELNGKFYLLGGRGNKEIAVYDPQSKIWSRTHTLLNNIHHFQALAYDNKIYIMGALTDNFPNEDPYPNILIYDPVQNTLTDGPEVPEARRRGSSGVVLYQDKFYIVGGNRNGHRSKMEDGTTPAHVSWFDCYDPVNDTWEILADAPHARDHFHAAVFQDKMFVAGGRRSSQDIPSVGSAGDTEVAVDVYDFTNNRWLVAGENPSDLPSPRAGASNAILGNELLVIGGETTDNLESLLRVEALDLDLGTWRRLDDLNTGRHGTQAIVYQGDVYLAAGSEQPGNDEITNQEDFMEAYSCDGPLYQWQNKTNSFSTHLEGPAVQVEDKIYVFGGFVDALAASNICEYYDASTDTWTQLPNMLDAVTHLGAVRIGDEIWLPGGFDSGESALSTVQIFNMTSQTWRYGPELPEPFASNGVARLGNQVHVFGGLQFNRIDANTNHYFYDLDYPELGWQRAAPFTNGRNHFSTVTQRGKIYAIGGATGHDIPPVPEDLPTVTVYDPVSDSWTTLADLPASRSHNDPGSFITPDGRIITVGGRSFFGVTSGDAKLTMEEITIYDPISNTWMEFGVQEARRLAPFARLVGNEMFIGSGGTRWDTPTSELKCTKVNFSEIKELGFSAKATSFQLNIGETADLTALLWTLYGETTVTLDIQSGAEWLSLNNPPASAISEGVPVYATIQTQNVSSGTYQAVLVASAPGFTSATLQIDLVLENPNQIGSSAWLEAECAQIGSNWMEESSADASKGNYVVYRGASNSINRAPEDIPENYVRFPLDMSEGGVYHIFARYKAFDHSQNSFWVRLNDGEWIKWWQGLDPSTEFRWAKIAATTFTLLSGNNTLDIAYREKGAQLDKIYVDQTGQQPTDLGTEGSNCTNPSPNLPPQLTLVPDLQSEEGSEISNLSIVSALDNENDVLIYNATGLPEGLSMSQTTGLVSGIISANPGNYEVYLSVTDNVNPPVLDTLNWEIRALPVNLSPQLTVVLNPQTETGTTITGLAIVSAQDNENDALQYSAEGLPASLNMDPASGLVSGNLSANPGIYEVTVNVSDNTNPAVSTLVNWEVTSVPVNQAPQVSVALNPQTEEGATVSDLAIVNAQDTENDPLTYDALGLPQGLMMDKASGLVSGTLNATPGMYDVTVQVTDSINAAVSVSVNWEITARPVPEKFFISLEAECAEQGSNWTKESSPDASEGEFIVFLADDLSNKRAQPQDVSPESILRFPFEVTHTDNYEVFARLSAPDAGGDSYWIRFDESGPWHYVYCFQIIGKGFRWLKITSSTISSPVSLEAGSHVMEILYRENGTLLDKFMLRRDGLTPQGMGEVAENTCQSTNEAPVALAQSDVNQGLAPLSVNLDASGSTDDKGIVSYEWSWMEGDESRTAQGVQTQVSFPEGTYQVSLTVRDEEGLESQSSLLIISEGPVMTQSPIRINAGGPELDANGLTFIADNYFSVNTKSFTIKDLSADILNTDADALYQTERSSINDLEEFTYNIPVENGSYLVRVHLAEIYWGAPTAGPGGANRRVLSATLEGQAMPGLTDLDLNAQVGPITALIVEQEVEVSDQSMDIAFSASVNQAKVSAIELIPNANAQMSSLANQNNAPQSESEVIYIKRVYENPLIAGQDLHVELSSPYNGDIQFDIYSENGLHVASGLKLLSNESLLQLDLSNLDLKMGIYYLYVQGVGIKNEAQRLIKN